MATGGTTTPAGVNLSGTEGDDILSGGAGNDTLRGGGGKDRLSGDAGQDVLDGGSGDDLLDGGAGDDVLEDREGSNMLYGGEGKDRLIVGSTGSSALDGITRNDHMDGGAGDDELVLQALNEKTWSVTMSGGDGDDLLHVARANASVKVIASGGAGSDVFRISAISNLSIADFSTGDQLDLRPLLGAQNSTGNPFGELGYLKAVQDGTRVQIHVDYDGASRNGSNFELAATLENTGLATLTSAAFAGGFAVTGTNRGLDLRGTADADVLRGESLDDIIDGGAGNDVLAGSLGNDRLSGGEGNDQLDGDRTSSSSGQTIENGQASTPTGDDVLDGGAGDDRLTTSWGADQLLGGAGNDVLTVSAASSNLPASSYQVRLDGGDGQDRLVVSSSVRSAVTVSMSGGAGSDTFELGLNPRLQGAVKIITDFQPGAGGDVLDMFESMGFLRQSPFASGHFLLEQRGADTVVRYDDSGPSSPGPVFDVVILKNVAKEALTVDNMRYGFAPDGRPATLTPEQRGTDGRDRLDGDADFNALYGGDGNDVLAGFGGNDYLNGGSGIDTAVFRGAADQYTIALVNLQDFMVSDRRGGLQDGKDRLVGVERLSFSDKTLAVAVGEDGGAAFQAYRIYRAAFDRAPDEVGLGFWIGMLDRGASLHAVADGFARSTEFAALYGANPSNAEIVTRLYRNILDREPEPEGYAYWLSVLDNRLADLGTVLAAFSESQENQDAVWLLVGNGIFYQPYIG